MPAPVLRERPTAVFAFVDAPALVTPDVALVTLVRLVSAERDNFRRYILLATSLLSAESSLLVWLFNR